MTSLADVIAKRMRSASDIGAGLK